MDIYKYLGAGKANFIDPKCTQVGIDHNHSQKGDMVLASPPDPELQ